MYRPFQCQPGRALWVKIQYVYIRGPHTGSRRIEPNWNSWEVLEASLCSLPAALGGMSSEIWGVDNASSDGSVARIRQIFPQVHLVANTVNAGFAAANNQAAGQAQGRYFLLLYPDTDLLPGSIETLWRYPTVTVTNLGQHSINQDPEWNLPQFYAVIASSIVSIIHGHPPSWQCSKARSSRLQSFASSCGRCG